MFVDDDLFAQHAGRWPLWQRIVVPAGGVAVLAGAGFLAFTMLKGSGPAPRPHQEPHITQVMLPPPPPPPPPKPPPPTPQKMVQDKPKESVSPQKSTVAKAMKAPSPPAAVTTSITGPGAGSLAAGNGGGGDCVGQGCGTGDGTGGDNDAYYSGIVKSQIEAAIRRDDRLRFEKYRLRVTFQLDASGHVSHASIADFSGESDIEAEVSRVLQSVSTNDAPPADMTTKTFTVSIIERARG